MASARIIQFPMIPRREAYDNWYAQVGTLEEIQEYREFLNRVTADRIERPDFTKKKDKDND